MHDPAVERDPVLTLLQPAEQVEHGAHVVDVCTAYVGRDEVADLRRAVSRFATDVTAPLMIDSTEPAAIEAALKLTGEIEKVIRAARDMHLAIRGLFGEGTEAIGDFFQISNQTTLGVTEQEVVENFSRRIVPRIVEYELKARQLLTHQESVLLDDKISRSLGLLQNARMLSSEETMYLLSHIRMGVHLGRVRNVELKTINELFLQTQPAHLQVLHGQLATTAEQRKMRAKVVRSRLGDASMN